MYRLIHRHFITIRICHTIYRHIRKFPVPNHTREHPFIAFCLALGGAIHHIKQKEKEMRGNV